MDSWVCSMVAACQGERKLLKLVVSRLLLGAERRHRICTSCATGRKNTGHEAHDEQHQWNHRQRERIAATDSIEGAG